jgi:hypothetical protein
MGAKDAGLLIRSPVMEEGPMSTLKFQLALLSVCGWLPLAAVAQVTSEPIQTLDSVSVSSSAPNKALEMGFDDPLVRSPDFKAYAAASSSGFKSCQKTSSRGLFCLDGKMVKNWSSLTDTSAENLFSCEDPALGLDRRSDTCTSLSVNLAGEFWLAGKDGSAYALIKVVRKPDTGCAAGFSQLANSPNYCFKKAYRGRPLLLDIQAIDGEFADRFTYGAGVLGLERREDLVFFPENPTGTPILIANKSGWGLSGNESLQSGSVVQRLDGGVTDNFAMVTTGTGKVLAKYLPFPPGTSTAFYTGYTIPAERLLPLPTSPACNGTAGYQIRGSGTSGLVYVADRAACQVAALEPTYTYLPPAPPPAQPFTLTNVQVGDPPKDFTLSTRSTVAGTSYPPDSIAISPGIEIDFADCSNGKTCPWIPDNNDGNAFNGAEMSGVVYTGPGNMALFQVKNIPDCRFISPTICQQPRTVITAGGKRYLNVTPLLPAEVQRLFPNGQGPAPSQLPELLISDEYQARSPAHTFDAFFGVTDPAIRFRENFTLQFDIGQLTGGGTRCGTSYNVAPYDWDLILTVSERFPTVGGPTGQTNTPYVNGNVTGTGREHVEMLLNGGCFNPTTAPKTGSRISLYAYGMQPKPNPLKPERTYTDLVAKLFYDLIDTQNRLACTNVDAEVVLDNPPVNPPLRPATCDSLFASWDNARDKLEKCFLATNEPKSSAGDQTCNAFNSQMTNYIGSVEGAARWGDDPANRIGELASRGRVIQHVFNDHFLPTIPPGGIPAP